MGIYQRDEFFKSNSNPIIKPLKEFSKTFNNPLGKDADLLMPI